MTPQWMLRSSLTALKRTARRPFRSSRNKVMEMAFDINRWSLLLMPWAKVQIIFRTFRPSPIPSKPVDPGAPALRRSLITSTYCALDGAFDLTNALLNLASPALLHFDLFWWCQRLLSCCPSNRSWRLGFLGSFWLQPYFLFSTAGQETNHTQRRAPKHVFLSNRWFLNANLKLKAANWKLTSENWTLKKQIRKQKTDNWELKTNMKIKNRKPETNSWNRQNFKNRVLSCYPCNITQFCC